MKKGPSPRIKKRPSLDMKKRQTLKIIKRPTLQSSTSGTNGSIISEEKTRLD